IIKAGEKKAKLLSRDLWVRGFLSGSLLGFATMLVCTLTLQLGFPFLGALVFLGGFVMLMFLGLGLEHCVVNILVIPMGLMLGPAIIGNDWWLWNQVPLTLENIFGGVTFTSLALYMSYAVPDIKNKINLRLLFLLRKFLYE